MKDTAAKFKAFHASFRAICRRGFKVGFKGSRYESDRPHIGKKATRHAKRLKVAAMKEAGHFRGDNRPFEIVSQ